MSSLIEAGRHSAARQVNTVLMATYWFMGQRIIRHEQKGEARAGYGEALLERLGKDLSSKYGKGFSQRNLELSRQFYLTYRIPQTLSAESHGVLNQKPGLHNQLVLQKIGQIFPLSWSHYCLLMRIEEKDKREFYEKLCIQGHWSVRQLDREIQALLYERTSLSKRKELVLAKANENPIIVKPEDEVRDSYVLDFLGLKNEYSELNLENALIHHLENFLLELGRGFTFVARQKRFAVDGDEYRIDLLLYHISLKCYVIIELKIGKFTHNNAGQINFYVNWAKENVLPQAENEPIGIILCSDKNNTTVRYATGGLINKIFVSKYQLQLPKPEELQRELERGRELFLQNQSSRESNPDQIEKTRGNQEKQ
jgi:predicted nuclease of restriction endonuclease-like (RecB) superfamily